jgi:hypothetical protein
MGIRPYCSWNSTPHQVLQALSVARGFQERFEESISLARKLVEILGRTVHTLWALAQAYAVAGETEAPRHMLRDLEELQGSIKGAATQVAILYGLLGETDRAFVQPRMDCLRSDPRLHDMLARLNLLKPRIA